MFLSPGLHLCVSGTYYAKPHFRRAGNQSSTDMNAFHIFFSYFFLSRRLSDEMIQFALARVALMYVFVLEVRVA